MARLEISGLNQERGGMSNVKKKKQKIIEIKEFPNFFETTKVVSMTARFRLSSLDHVASADQAIWRSFPAKRPAPGLGR